MKYSIRIFDKDDQPCGGFDVLAIKRKLIHSIAKEFCLKHGGYSYSIGKPQKKNTQGVWETVTSQAHCFLENIHEKNSAVD